MVEEKVGAFNLLPDENLKDVFNSGNHLESTADLIDLIPGSQPFRYEIPEIGVALSGLKSQPHRVFLYWFLSFISFGIFWFVSLFLPFAAIYIRNKYVPFIDCDHVLFCHQDEVGKYYKVEKVKKLNSMIYVDYMYERYILSSFPEHGGQVFGKFKYILDGLSFESIFHRHCRGLDQIDASNRKLVYGSNSMNIPIPSYFELFYTQVLHYFYLFQFISVMIWIWDEYYVYAVVIVFMSAVTIIFAVYLSKKNFVRLANMVSEKSVLGVVRLDEEGQSTRCNVSCEDIVPGDLVEITVNTVLMCDMLLIQGYCVVNESTLTGESTLVPKNAIPSMDKDLFYSNIHSRHVLYCGTTVVEVKDSTFTLTKANGLESSPIANLTLGIAIKTGFSTQKGRMVQAMLYPRPTGFNFYRDSMRFIGVLAIIASFGFLFTIGLFTYYNSPINSMFKRALDLITIAVPPALPIAMTIATAFSVSRMKADHIYCIQPQRVNVCGCVGIMCLDKTGTLTEDYLDIYGVFQCTKKLSHINENENSNIFHFPLIQSIPNQPLIDSTTSPNCPTTPFGISSNQELGFRKRFFTRFEHANKITQYALASCHTISQYNGQFFGDSLELKMFENTNWEMKKPNIQVNSNQDSQTYQFTSTDSHLNSHSNKAWIIDDDPFQQGSTVRSPDGSVYIQRLLFMQLSSLLQRMTVVTRVVELDPDTVQDIDPKPISSSLLVFTKGAPEMIKRFCLPDTIPLDYDQIMNSFTQIGKRVLALASRQLPSDMTTADLFQFNRKEIEDQLHFFGFLILENQLKPGSKSAVQKLNKGSTTCIMVTGDNEYTATNVALECDLIPKAISDRIYLVTVDKTEIDSSIIQNHPSQICSPLRYTHVPTNELVQVNSSPTTGWVFDDSIVPNPTSQMDQDDYSHISDFIHYQIDPNGVIFHHDVAPNVVIDFCESDINSQVILVETEEIRTEKRMTKKSLRSFLLAPSEPTIHYETSTQAFLEDAYHPDSNSSISSDNEDGDILSLSQQEYLLERKIVGALNAQILPNVLQDAVQNSQQFDLSSQIECPPDNHLLTDQKNQIDVTIDHPLPTDLISKPNISSNLTTTSLPSNALFVLHGSAFQYLYEEPISSDSHLLDHFLERTLVYARMSPFDKEHLIQSLQSHGHIVAMCGDGANDVAALRQADVGLSLSEAESSIAAPFTSNNPSISSAVLLLREGRCALTSSIQCYKYMASYSLIQLTVAILAYSIWWDSKITGMQYLWMDVIIVLPLALVMGRTHPSRHLTSQRPLGCLMSFSVVGSLLAQVIIHLIYLLTFFLFLEFYYIPKYIPNVTFSDSKTLLVTILFLTSNYFYITTCIAFSISKPYRRPIWTNRLLLGSLIIITFLNFFITISSSTFLSTLLELSPIGYDIIFMIFSIVTIDFFTCFGFERLIISGIIQKTESSSLKNMEFLNEWRLDNHLI